MNNPVKYIDPDGRNPITAVYRAYKGYKAYQAYQSYKVTRNAAVAAGTGAVIGTGSREVYNFYVSGNMENNAEKVANSLISRANTVQETASPEYNNQRKREGDARDKRNQEQANVQQTVINGGHNPQDSGGDFNPNPNNDPKDGIKKAALVTGVAIVAEQITANGDSSIKQNLEQVKNFIDKIKDFFDKTK
jgi:hypothetical protein